MLVCANDGPSRRVVVLVVAVMERIVCGYGCNVFGYLPLPFDHFFFAFPPAGAIVMCCAVLVVKGGEGEVNVNVDSQVCASTPSVTCTSGLSLCLSERVASWTQGSLYSPTMRLHCYYCCCYCYCCYR